jgi:hypothetical protein
MARIMFTAINYWPESAGTIRRHVNTGAGEPCAPNRMRSADPD